MNGEIVFGILLRFWLWVVVPVLLFLCGRDMWREYVASRRESSRTPTDSSEIMRERNYGRDSVTSRGARGHCNDSDDDSEDLQREFPRIQGELDIEGVDEAA